jgi:TPR repeat protein
MERFIRTAGAVLLLAAGALATAADNHDLLQRSDALSRQESRLLRDIYDAGNAAFATGDYAAAFREYDYAAWHGSVAAASRLCVLDAYGIGTVPNPVKAAYWCERAAAAGHDTGSVRRYLDAYRVVNN